MKIRLSIILCFVILGVLSCHETTSLKRDKITQKKNVDYVNPFIGTGFHGHTYPGAVMPFGKVQLSPDTRINYWDASSGYHFSDSTMYGFSHTHLSGTGIGDLGDVLFSPYTGEKPLDSITKFSHDNEIARPGYYSVVLDDYNIKCELTATSRTGWHKYTYPTNKEAGLLIDLGHILRKDLPNTVIEGSIKIIDDKTIEGYHLTDGWAEHDPIWFKAVFNKPFKVSKLETELGNQDILYKAKGKDIKLYLSFGFIDEPIIAKVALSSVDENGPDINLVEIEDVITFDQVENLASKAWQDVLSLIQIKSSDEDVLTNFYTALYRTHLAPSLFSDADGRYMGMDKKIHINKTGETYTTFSLWDTFRAWFPLMTIIQPEKSTEWVYNLYQASEEGYILPKWPLNGNYTGTMVGYPAMSIIADAMTKGLADSIPEKLVNAGIKTATWQPDWLAKNTGRWPAGAMTQAIMYKENMRYVPANKYNKSVSWGLEMAYYDWCLSVMAKQAGNDYIASKWFKKGQYYKNYFDKSTGFMRGLNDDGTWVSNFNPRFSSHGKGEYTEGNAYQWSPFVPHDIIGLKELLGGDDAFEIWLDTIFTESSDITGEDVSMDITGLIGQYAHGNEPGHHIPYLYNYTNNSDKTSEKIDSILYSFYKPTPDGIIGNEDCGQMSAWYVLSAMGFYQVCPGKPIYDLGRPIIDEASIKVNDGYFKIKVHNNSKRNKYIKKAMVDGKPIIGKQFEHASIKAGSVLEIFMN